MLRRIFLPFILTFSLIACCIEVDISVPGFPDMATYFGVPGGTIQLTIAYNFIGFCLAALFYGPLSECYGRRAVMIAGNALLVLGAFGCLMSQSIPVLLLFRFIQGIGASTAAVLVFAIIADTYPSEKSVKFIAIMNSALTVFMAGAPVIGGFINEAIGWRGNYGIVAGVCMLSWCLLFFGLEESKTTFETFRFKKIVSDYGRLFASAPFMSAALIPSLLYATYMAFIACCSFLYLETFKLPVSSYVLHQASIIGVFSVMSMFASHFINRWGEQTCTWLSFGICGLSAAGFVLSSVLFPDNPFWVTGNMIICQVGAAVGYPLIFAKSLEIFPDIKGTASSAIMSLRALLCSVYVGLSSYCYDGRPISIAWIVFSGVLLSIVLLYKLRHSGSGFTRKISQCTIEPRHRT